ncbi:hypothetical protein CP985_11840 [Malaciobacter mytili LMG 24559]|uniref:Uncharacterized protein n=1 Tax=Malaciobacter mytili LMG 24559 TaxID=1032238 RepID=A0AAX2ADR5_9BACT|nr:hypothetical protein [Malaciobacter mytili]AXH16345.1 hypothetical protein AMYT_a0045 [Malaciobacter mytili LMG 24559]RXK14804.1 hypothetical protein CP985_11840 [Malaciobacter mytili LMG 24559]
MKEIENNSLLKKLEKEASELGNKAFNNGIPRTPIYDDKLLQLFKKYELKVSEGATIFKAWLDSWDTSNLKEITMNEIKD